MADIKPCYIFQRVYHNERKKKENSIPVFIVAQSKKSLSKDDEKSEKYLAEIRFFFLLGCIMRITYGKSIIKYARYDVVVAACI